MISATHRNHTAHHADLRSRAPLWDFEPEQHSCCMSQFVGGGGFSRCQFGRVRQTVAAWLHVDQRHAVGHAPAVNPARHHADSSEARAEGRPSPPPSGPPPAGRCVVVPCFALARATICPAWAVRAGSPSARMSARNASWISGVSSHAAMSTGLVLVGMGTTRRASHAGSALRSRCVSG